MTQEEIMIIVSIISIVVSAATALFVLYVEIIVAKRNRKIDRENALRDILRERVDQYANMTTNVLFAQRVNIYQSLSLLLYENYVNIIDLITTTNPEITADIENTFRKMCIQIEAYSYIFNPNLNEKLWTFKDMTESIFDCIVNNEQDNELPTVQQTDELYNLYKQIKSYFDKDIGKIQSDIKQMLEDFLTEYQKLYPPKQKRK